MNVDIEKKLLLIAIIACALSFTLSYGISNQNTYLIHGLTLIEPNFLKGDWFAHSVKHYHKNFSLVILLVDSMGLPISGSLVFIEMLLRIIALFSIYKTIYLISEKQKYTSALLVFSLIVLERTYSVAGSYIFSSMLQPSSFAATFLLVSMYFFLRGNYFFSGLAMAFSGFMHTNFLILGFVVFGIAHLFIGAEGFVKRMSAQFSLMLTVFVFQVPFLLGMISSEHGEQATYIFQFIRSPHHYVPDRFLFSFYKFFGWSILGVVGLMLLKVENDLKKKLIGIYSGLLIPVIIATALTTIVFIPVISKLFFWRMAPFGVNLAQTVFVVSLNSGFLCGNKCSNNKNIVAGFLISLGVLLIYRWYYFYYGIVSQEFVFLTCIFMVLLAINFVKISYNYFKCQISPQIIQIFVAVLTLIILVVGVNQGFKRSTLFNGYPSAVDLELYKWINNTNVCSRFLVPPDLQDFRLRGERAIIVDWKSTPIDPDGLIEWYERIQDISGRNGIYTLEEANEGYSNLDRKNLKLLKDKYSISYAVFYADKNTLSYHLPIVFQNNKYVVIELESL